MKIQEIHESNLYGIIIETGAGCALASSLYSEENSSKTVYHSDQPYCKDYEEDLYGSFSRSVSKDFIEAVLNKEEVKLSTLCNFHYGFDWNKTDKCFSVNFLYASSWQLNSDNPNGWIGVLDLQRNVKHFLHFTFQPNAYYNRKSLIDRIGEIGVNILHTLISGDINEFDNNTKILRYLPVAILDMAYINEAVNYRLLISTLEKAKDDYFLVFENNQPTRLVDLLRKSDEFIINKGSFDPLHQGHLVQMTDSVKVFKKATPAFLISTFRYDKQHLNYDELKERIEMLAKANYPLILCKSVTFYETFSLLQKWSFNKKFNFSLGTDTINRIYQSDFDSINQNSLELKYLALEYFIKTKVESYRNNFKFLLFPRKNVTRLEGTHLYDDMIQEFTDYVDDGISSTEIREGLLENKIKL